ncbi:MAG: UvrD-helicase domain-containing protein [Christensenellaceae bacterium]|nr:UvrD-helicase domain-containing protein [Christensenellaceae bacterium]
MNREDGLNELAQVLCSTHCIQECLKENEGKCLRYGKCKIDEKTDKQIEYILSPKNKCIYLEACAGSGKTEVLGLKAAYEVCKWELDNAGIAVLTFTNEAASTILDRIALLYPRKIPSIHYIGTFSSFVHGFIAQKFGYAFFRKDCTDQDCSFSIIDKNVRSYNNNWLENYALEFPSPPRKTKICANQLSFRLSDKSWFINIGDADVSLNEYYNSEEMQTFIDSLRKQARKEYLFGYDYLLQKVKECKKKFWKAGFATFEDMSIIAHTCLKDEAISKLLSKKFPLVMVDECQDLSYIELEILGFLQTAGSVIHFIGDLNQAIYSFKDAQPAFLRKHILERNYDTKHLIENFRSTQKIVDVSCALQGIEKRIIGSTPSLCDGNDALYYEYSSEEEAIQRFTNLIKQHNIPLEKSIVLVRNTSLKSKVTQNDNAEYDKHMVINAIQLWNTDFPEEQLMALQLIGLQIQKWIKTQGRKDKFYCPNSFCDNVFAWRLTLRDILRDLSKNNSICTLDGQSYSEWYRSAKGIVLGCVDKHIQGLLGFSILDKHNPSFRTPSGTASQLISPLPDKNKDFVKVETIHAVKGCSYDAVLLLSSSDARGRTGYWENWIDDKAETTRFAYVACTRPHHLLCWGIARLHDEEQRTKIESMGLVRLT